MAQLEQVADLIIVATCNRWLNQLKPQSSNTYSLSGKKNQKKMQNNQNTRWEKDFMHKVLARENQTESQRAASNLRPRPPQSFPTAAQRTREPVLATSIHVDSGHIFIKNFGKNKITGRVGF